MDNPAHGRELIAWSLRFSSTSFASSLTPFGQVNLFFCLSINTLSGTPSSRRALACRRLILPMMVAVEGVMDKEGRAGADRERLI